MTLELRIQPLLASILRYVYQTDEENMRNKDTTSRDLITALRRTENENKERFGMILWSLLPVLMNPCILFLSFSGVFVRLLLVLAQDFIWLLFSNQSILPFMLQSNTSSSYDSDSQFLKLPKGSGSTELNNDSVQLRQKNKKTKQIRLLLGAYTISQILQTKNQEVLWIVLRIFAEHSRCGWAWWGKWLQLFVSYVLLHCPPHICHHIHFLLFLDALASLGVTL